MSGEDVKRLTPGSAPEPGREIGVGAIGYGIRLEQVIEKLWPHLEGRGRFRCVFDPAKPRVAAARDRFGGDVRVAERVEAVCDADDVDWVFIGSWNSQHAGQIEAALRAGKHVFCEKPLATTLPDTMRIARACAESGSDVVVGFVLRYAAHYRRIKELIDQGAIGDIISLEFNETLKFNHGGQILSGWRRLRANGGPSVLEKCCHDMDIMQWLTGSRPHRVASFGGLDFFTPENARHMERIGRDDQGRLAYRVRTGDAGPDPFNADKDVEDNRVAILELESGARATFHLNYNSGIPERRNYICGTEGAIRAEGIAGRIELCRMSFDMTPQDVSTGGSSRHCDVDPPLAEELAQVMLQGRPPAAGVREGLEAGVTCLGMDESMLSGQIVDLQPHWDALDAVLGSRAGGRFRARTGQAAGR